MRRLFLAALAENRMGNQIPTEPLDREEQAQLRRCEAVIAKGWPTFLEVGRALALIRDQRLYHAQHETFEVYCRQKWGYARQHAYRLIGAAQVVEHLSPMGDIPRPLNERQVRPLIGLSPEQVREVWQQVVTKSDGKPVTANIIRRKAAAYREPAQKPASNPEPASQARPAPSHQQTDRILNLLTSLEQAFRRGAPSDTILSLLTALRELIQSMASPIIRMEPGQVGA